MSLMLALQSALSSLTATQSALQVAAYNVANVNTDGYSRKTVGTTAQVAEGVGVGVELTGIVRHVDESLARQVRDQLATVAQLEQRDNFLACIQNLFGSLASDGTISHSVTTLATSIERLSTAPESPASRAEVVSTAQNLADELSFLSSQIQQMRRDADQQIAQTVSDINELSKQIAGLNQQITEASLKNQPIGELQDLRDASLLKMAALVDISTFARADGQISVFVGAARPLVDCSFSAA